MKTLGSHTGYLDIDHRNSPGLTPADVAHLPVPTLAVGKGRRLERDTKQCSHCQRGIVLNPGRVRDRAVCPKCQHYICDSCNLIRLKSGVCRPFAAILDRADTLLHRGWVQSGDLLEFVLSEPMRESVCIA